MIDLYTWTTPNGRKVSILLEELGVDYTVHSINIDKGEQKTPDFLKISPNNKIPAIVDHDNGMALMESGAIMWYLSEKYGKYLPTDPLGRKEAMEWLFWQVGNQGPMAGQLSHFVNYAPVGIGDYGRERYAREYDRCLGVLERRLAGRDYILGDYSIADMVSWPWVLIAKPLGATLEPFPNVTAWRSRLKNRPAVQRAVDLGKDMRRQAPPTDDERKLLYEQTAASIGKLSDERA